jgi:hypothetical protein
MFGNGVPILGIITITMRRKMAVFGYMEEIINIGSCAVVPGAIIPGVAVRRFVSKLNRVLDIPAWVFGLLVLLLRLISFLPFCFEHDVYN